MRTTSLTAALGLATALAVTPSLVAPASADAPTCDAKTATIVVQPTTTWPKPWVVGTPGDDVIVGTDGRDRIDGGAGNDTICSLGSDDHVVGGAGDDRLFGGLDEYYPDDDYWGDVIEPGPGDDFVDLGFQGGWKDIDFVDSVYADQVSYANAAGPVTVDLTTLTATGEGTDTFAATPAGKFTGIVGSPYDDVLTGGPADDQIHGGGGDDTITGGPGDDLVHGDLNWAPDKRSYDTSVPGDDVVEGGAGDDVVEGGHGADILAGEDGEDYLVSAGDAAGTRPSTQPAMTRDGARMPNNVQTDRDGNVYRQNSDRQWNERQGNSWNQPNSSRDLNSLDRTQNSRDVGTMRDGGFQNTNRGAGMGGGMHGGMGGRPGGGGGRIR